MSAPYELARAYVALGEPERGRAALDGLVDA
jgi:hypothetical protein